jgi:two-component system chemotaxis response regulator CheB
VALSKVIPLLPGDFPLPVVVVQHMPPVFTQALARDLDDKSHLTVTEARAGTPLATGTVHIAPGGHHLVVRLREGVPVIAIDDGPPENSCKPSADVLFRSLLPAFGSRGVLALIMTGMGSDGAAGVAALKEKNCYCLTQSQQSCVVYGMPGAVVDAGLSDEILDLDEIAARIVSLAGGRRR